MGTSPELHEKISLAFRLSHQREILSQLSFPPKNVNSCQFVKLLSLASLWFPFWIPWFDGNQVENFIKCICFDRGTQCLRVVDRSLFIFFLSHGLAQEMNHATIGHCCLLRIQRTAIASVKGWEKCRKQLPAAQIKGETNDIIGI